MKLIIASYSQQRNNRKGLLAEKLRYGDADPTNHRLKQDG